MNLFFFVGESSVHVARKKQARQRKLGRQQHNAHRESTHMLVYVYYKNVKRKTESMSPMLRVFNDGAATTPHPSTHSSPGKVGSLST